MWIPEDNDVWDLEEQGNKDKFKTAFQNDHLWFTWIIFIYMISAELFKLWVGVEGRGGFFYFIFLSLILLTYNTIISNDFSWSSILLKMCVTLFNNLFKRYYGKTEFFLLIILFDIIISELSENITKKY